MTGTQHRIGWRFRRAVNRLLVLTVAATSVGLVGTALPAHADTTVTVNAGGSVLAKTLTFNVTTGSNPLHAHDDANVMIIRRDGSTGTHSLNAGASWAAGSQHAATWTLDRSTMISEISSITFRRHRCSSCGADSWKLGSVSVSYGGDMGTGLIASAAANFVFTDTNSWRLNLRSLSPAPGIPASVDRTRYNQQFGKNQNPRGTCIDFASVAAIEAAYGRVGIYQSTRADGSYNNLDLSEEFMNWMQKSLTVQWRPLANSSTNEAQLATTDGGGAWGDIEVSADGLRIPTETVAPYHAPYYTAEADGNAALRYAYDDPYFTDQHHTDDVNLDPNLLKVSSMANATFYGVRQSGSLVNPTNITELEAVLASGHEVVWDFEIHGPTGAFWTPNPAYGKQDHAVSLIGYNHAQRYFLVKNSWGETAPIRMSYDYAAYGHDASYVVSVITPQTWPEFQFFGRWNLDFDGWRGTLDVYHMPGTYQKQINRFGTGVTDRRIGIFTDTAGHTFRVNGSISGNTIDFYIDPAHPNMTMDQLTGRHYTYRMMPGQGSAFMAGTHSDGSAVYGGYATKGSFLPRGAATPKPLGANSYVGSRWSMRWLGTTSTLVFGANTVTSTRSGYSQIPATYQSGSTSRSVTAFVKNADPRTVDLRMPNGSTTSTVTTRHFTWEAGVSAGAGLTLVRL